MHVYENVSLFLMLLFIFNRDHIEWNQISNNVKPGGNFVVLDLEPATWYNVRITAHNSAGFTVAEYEFATLTVTGGNFFLSKIVVNSFHFKLYSQFSMNHFRYIIIPNDDWENAGIH